MLGLSHFVQEQMKGWGFKKRKSQSYCEDARFNQGDYVEKMEAIEENIAEQKCKLATK